MNKRKEKLAAAKAKKEERDATVKQAVNTGLDPQAILFATQQLALPANQRFMGGLPMPSFGAGNNRVFNRPMYSIEGNRPIPPPRRPPPAPRAFRVEYALTASNCHACGTAIGPASLRFLDRLNHFAYHVHCYRPPGGSQITGVARLSADDQAIIRALLD